MSDSKKYGKWTEESMDRAITSFRNGDMGLNAVCRTYGVPKATLKRRLDGVNIYGVDEKKHFGRGVDLSEELEKDLVQHVLALEESFFGITRKDLKSLAFQLAEENNIPHRFNKEAKMAGDKWYYSFMERHPQLSLRQPEATSVARSLGFSKERVAQFFTVLKKVIDENKFQAIDIYNMDESGLSTVQKPPKKLAKKGKHQVGAITSGERGLNTTGIFCVSAAGTYVPPMLIFKRVRFKNELRSGAPPGTKFSCSESGWITSELFVQWLEHFIGFVKPSREKKVLLILDGHTTHTKNLTAIQLAIYNGIVMLSLPPHTTHKLKPLSSYYRQAADKWMRTNPMQKITQFQISQLLGESYGRAASISNATSGFLKTGIWPVNENVFNDFEFVPSTICVTLDNDNTVSIIEQPQSQQNRTEENENNLGLQRGITAAKNARTTPADISPLPTHYLTHTSKIQPIGLRKTRKPRESAHSTILTSNIHAELLKQKLEQKKDANKSSGNIPTKILKKKLERKKDSKRSKRRKLDYNSPTTSNAWFCKLCKVNEERDMIQCMICMDWVHELCAKVSPSTKSYFCEECDEA